MTYNQSDVESCDVCIVGAGPVGIYLAVNLATAGIKTFAFDLLPQLTDDPRAISHMPVLFKDFEKVGILKQMKDASRIHSGAISFRRTQDQKVIEKIPPIPNRPGPLVCPQKAFCEILLGKIKDLPNAKLDFGQNVVKMEQNADGVLLTVEDVTSKKTRQVRCRFLVGADGAKSIVRKSMGLEYQGESLPFKLIAADLIFPFEKYGFEGANFMLDPDNYGIIALFAETEQKETVWRVSAGFPSSMSDEAIMDGLPEKFQSMFPEMKADSYRLLRAQPYDLHQFCVPSLIKDSAILVGDAAHLANPYSGQSLACGIFDASSLADCLVPVLKGEAPESLLEEWSQDRILKFKTVMDPLSRRCFEAVRDPDVESVAQRHPFLKAMKAGPAGPPPPSLATDATKLKSWPSKSTGSGAEGGTDNIHLIWNKV